MAQPAQPSDLRTYRGNCHCGAFVYEVDLPEIKMGVQCNCSYCSKKGYFLAIGAAKGNFRVVKGSEDALVSYIFGPKQKIHKFCPVCATSVLTRMPDGPPHLKLVLNIHAIQGIDSRFLKRMHHNGAVIGGPYGPPAHKGNVPAQVAESEMLYTGSCHCGAVTLAIKSEPIDNSRENLRECNCSICERNAYIWLLLQKEKVVLAGNEEDIGRYKFASGSVSKTFCKTCGVNMTSIVNSLTEEGKSAFIERFRPVHEEYLHFHPVNARTLNGIDVSELSARFFDGATLMPPYENP